ncbi:VV20781 family protein [Sandarakinorhabdus oryzae]|uniref:hypothetical protein n=1 Tax=Sandarakinorhabdus oryzae TaxID=2675220 RepID=UPI001A9CB8B0|nr:hypothetical protein [Sandarakinorhabdus oryzae]
MRPLYPFILLLPLAGCSVSAARMALPAGVTHSTTEIAITGMGGGQSGRFTAGASSGRFSRRADRLGVMDPLFVANRGGSSFELSGPDVSGVLAARCGFSRQQMNIGLISITPGQLRYVCRFQRDGQPVAATLELQGRGGVLGALDGSEARDGIFEYDGVRLRIRSVHRVEGSPLPLPQPIGYSFSRDGQEIGAVDLNGPDKRLHAPTEPRLREATLVAAMALAVFWDPAEVDQGN